MFASPVAGAVNSARASLDDSVGRVKAMNRNNPLVAGAWRSG